MPVAVFSTALAQQNHQPECSYQALGSLAQQLVGARLFTLTIIDNTRAEARRVYTNMPKAYPVQGTKPIEENPWSTKVLARHEIFVANTIDAIAEVFFDFDLIRSLGCESVINIPVVVAGKVLGTINCLHIAGHYTAGRVARAEELKLPGAAAFMLAHSKTIQGDP